MKSLFYLVPGLEFHLGLKPLKCDTEFDNFVQCGVNNDHVLHVYASHSEFELNETTTEQNLGVNDDSGSDLDDDDYNVYGYCSSKESVTALIDHLFNGEEEVLELMRPRLRERFDGPEQLKRALAFYALANGYKLYYEVNNPMRLVAKCLKDNQEKKCPFRTYEYGTLITSNWIVRNHTKKIMINPTIKVRDIGHYGMLWSYAAEILNSSEGSSCKLGVDHMPNCRDGNNQIYPIVWVVVNVENKENWSWFMQCLSDDLGIVNGKGLTIISDQHKGIIKAAKAVIPLTEHRQCARHIYANFRKKFTEIKDTNKEAHKHLMERNLESWSRDYLRTDRACDADWFDEKMQRMREKHEKWINVIFPNIRKKFEALKDHHMYHLQNWKVVPSGESRFEVRNGCEGFKVDERLRTCTFRGWQLIDLPCEHGFAAIYFLYRDLEEYVSEWACPSKGEDSASAGVNTPTSVSERGRTTSGKGGFEMSTSSARAGVRVTRSGVRLRGGVYIRGNRPTKFLSNESRELGTINVKVVRSRARADGSRLRMYPDEIRPIGYGVSWDSINEETMLAVIVGSVLYP
ncbi:hypothetical protein Tco_0099099 [Tanacetum coccineum]